VSPARQARLTWRSAALEPDSGLSWRARLGACVYCEFARGDGVLDPAPSAATVAARMAVTVRTADSARRELDDAGWLRVERRPGRASRMMLVAGEPPQEMQGSDDATPARTPARTPAPGAPEPENQRTREPERTTADAVARDGGGVELDEILLAHVRAQRPDAGGIVAALVEALTELTGERLFADAELGIVGRHAKALLAQGHPRERVATAGLVALLRRRPELTQRLCGDLAARGAGAIVTRDEWQAYLNGSSGTGPLQAMSERRATLRQVAPRAPDLPCPECGTGAGRHAADCPTVTEGGRP
jgi:hypothetical protein